MPEQRTKRTQIILDRLRESAGWQTLSEPKKEDTWEIKKETIGILVKSGTTTAIRDPDLLKACRALIHWNEDRSHTPRELYLSIHRLNHKTPILLYPLEIEQTRNDDFKVIRRRDGKTNEHWELNQTLFTKELPEKLFQHGASILPFTASEAVALAWKGERIEKQEIIMAEAGLNVSLAGLQNARIATEIELHWHNCKVLHQKYRQPGEAAKLILQQMAAEIPRDESILVLTFNPTLCSRILNDSRAHGATILVENDPTVTEQLKEMVPNGTEAQETPDPKSREILDPLFGSQGICSLDAVIQIGRDLLTFGTTPELPPYEGCPSQKEVDQLLASVNTWKNCGNALLQNTSFWNFLKAGTRLPTETELRNAKTENQENQRRLGQLQITAAKLGWQTSLNCEAAVGNLYKTATFISKDKTGILEAKASWKENAENLRLARAGAKEREIIRNENHPLDLDCPLNQDEICRRLDTTPTMPWKIALKLQEDWSAAEKICRPLENWMGLWLQSTHQTLSNKLHDAYAQIKNALELANLHIPIPKQWWMPVEPGLLAKWRSHHKQLKYIIPLLEGGIPRLPARILELTMLEIDQLREAKNVLKLGERFGLKTKAARACIQQWFPNNKPNQIDQKATLLWDFHEYGMRWKELSRAHPLLENYANKWLENPYIASPTEELQRLEQLLEKLDRLRSQSPKSSAWKLFWEGTPWEFKQGLQIAKDMVVTLLSIKIDNFDTAEVALQKKLEASRPIHQWIKADGDMTKTIQESCIAKERYHQLSSRARIVEEDRLEEKELIEKLINEPQLKLDGDWESLAQESGKEFKKLHEVRKTLETFFENLITPETPPERIDKIMNDILSHIKDTAGWHRKAHIRKIINHNKELEPLWKSVTGGRLDAEKATATLRTQLYEHRLATSPLNIQEKLTPNENNPEHLSRMLRHRKKNLVRTKGAEIQELIKSKSNIPIATLETGFGLAPLWIAQNAGLLGSLCCDWLEHIKHNTNKRKHFDKLFIGPDAQKLAGVCLLAGALANEIVVFTENEPESWLQEQTGHKRNRTKGSDDPFTKLLKDWLAKERPEWNVESAEQPPRLIINNTVLLLHDNRAWHEQLPNQRPTVPENKERVYTWTTEWLKPHHRETLLQDIDSKLTKAKTQQSSHWFGETLTVEERVRKQATKKQNLKVPLEPDPTEGEVYKPLDTKTIEKAMAQDRKQHQPEPKPRLRLPEEEPVATELEDISAESKETSETTETNADESQERPKETPAAEDLLPETEHQEEAGEETNDETDTETEGTTDEVTAELEGKRKLAQRAKKEEMELSIAEAEETIYNMVEEELEPIKTEVPEQTKPERRGLTR